MRNDRVVPDLHLPVQPPADDGERVLFYVDSQEIAVDESGEVDRAASLYLGTVDGVHYWAVDVDGDGIPDGYFASPLMGLYGKVDETTWSLAGRAVQLVEWQRTHRFCGRCAGPTEAADNERAMRCSECGLMAFPRLAPAVITLITDDSGRALLARGKSFPIPMYSCLAGFVEPGENLEEAVQREVREEVGLNVGDVRYHGSQPWPFPHSLMIGFTAKWKSGEIDIDAEEIIDANWYTRDDLPPIPPGVSIARRLIDAWVESEIG